MTEPSSGRPGLRHRAIAELVGTAFLVMAVVGSGIAAQRLSPDDVGLQLLENALATGAALAALIIALQPASAAFNPVVTALERLTGALNVRNAVTLVAAQILGGLVGVVVANPADPNDQPINKVRDIRDDLQARITALLRDLNI
jgi:glycerol uptake facilitator-like aquaporin